MDPSDELSRLRERVAKLERALEDRDVLGQAHGLLMARGLYSVSEAHDLLTAQARQLKTGVGELAQQLVAEHHRRLGRLVATPVAGDDVDGSPANVDPAVLDGLLRSLDGPLVIVTTASNGERAGCVVGFHARCGDEPVRYSIWLSRSNHTYRVGLLATHMAVHVVDPADQRLIDLFGTTSGASVDKFTSCTWSPGPGGVPLLADCRPALVLERHTMWDDGNEHVCFVGSVVA